MLKNELSNLHTKGPLADMAYLRPDQVPFRYPFSKPLTYHLLNRGEIKSVLIHKPGSRRGIRLVSVASIEAYLARLAQEQQDEGFIPVVAREYNTGRRGRKSKDAVSSHEPLTVQKARRGGPAKRRLPHDSV
jgi:hypothetical protein